MKIRTKLLLSTVVPLVAIAGLGWQIVASSWHTSSEMAAVGRLVEFTTTVSSLVHETQKERGTTAGFLGSKGTQFGKQLADQRQLTDQRVEQFETFLQGFNANRFGQEFAAQVGQAAKLLSQLAATRQKVSSQTVATDDAIGYYTKMNGLLLDAAGKASLATTDGTVAVRINAFNAFLKSKERAGIERAVLSNTFAKDAFGPGMYDKFTALVSLQNAYLAEFENIAWSEDREYYQSTLDAPCVKRVEEYRQIAQQKAQQGGFGQDAAEWFSTITQKINLLKQVDDHLAEGLASLASQKASAAQWRLVGALTVTCVVIALMGVGSWWITHSILSRLAEITNRVRDISEGEGDLTKRLEESSDELGELAGGMNKFIQQIEDVVVQIAQTVQQLGQEAEELATTSTSLKGGANDSKNRSSSISASAEEMAINMKQTASASEQMSVSISNVSDAVASIRQSIQEIAAQSEQSSSVAQTATSQVESNNQRISQLGLAASEIGQVIDVIQDIAEQTNLLALNATIEAARAGEAGKGFAVVATEVKELAKQTSTATDGIRERVLAMQSCTEETVTAMRDIDTVIRDVRQISSTIAAAVAEQNQNVTSISHSVEESADASRALASGISESSIASDEITRSITHIDATLSGTVEGADATSRAGGAVAQLAAELQQRIAQFKTS